MFRAGLVAHWDKHLLEFHKRLLLFAKFDDKLKNVQSLKKALVRSIESYSEKSRARTGFDDVSRPESIHHERLL